MGNRPAHVKPPAHLTPTTPPPKPATAASSADPLGQNPVRYGDWTLKGVAIDF